MFSLSGNIKKYLFENLPAYFQLEDSLRDSSGEGALERFFGVMEPEFVYSYQKIKTIYQLTSPDQVEDSHLYFLGQNYGSPPTMFRDTSIYKKLLAGFRELMAFKGTEQGLEMIFKLLGASISITDATPEVSKHDIGLKHDNRVQYDHISKEFFFITIDIWNPSWEPPYTQKLVLEIVDIIYFMLPINVFLRDLTINEEIPSLGGDFNEDFNEDFYINDLTY